MKKLSKVLFVLGTGASMIAAATVSAGRLDGLSNDGDVGRLIAYGSIFLYWLLGVVFCWCLANYRTRWKQILLSISSSLICLVLAEVCLRMVIPTLGMREFEFIRSATQHHVLLPNTQYDLGRFEGRVVTVTTNADRLRSEYSVNSFISKKHRIVCLGDSFTFGAWVQAEDSYPAKLEQRLIQEGVGNVGVLNAGMLSYSPVLHEQLLRRTLGKYKPTVVTLMLDCTDIGDDYHYSRDIDITSPNPRFPGPLYTPAKPHLGALWRIAKPTHPFVLAPLKLARRLAPEFVQMDPLDYYKFRIPVGSAIEEDRFFIYRYPLDATRHHFEFSFSRIKAMAEYCQENKIQFVLFVAPRYHHWNPKESPENWEAMTYGDYKTHQNVIFEFFDNKQKSSTFPIVNMLPSFLENDEFPLVFKTDPHWNRTGNEFVAKIVAESIKPYLLDAVNIDSAHRP